MFVSGLRNEGGHNEIIDTKFTKPNAQISKSKHNLAVVRLSFAFVFSVIHAFESIDGGQASSLD